MSRQMVRAIVFDLDDTLYARRAFIFSGFDAVAAQMEATFGLPRAIVRQVLRDAHRSGARGREFQMMCERFGLSPLLVDRLVATVRAHRPTIRLPRDSAMALAWLRPTWRIGVLTNGDPAVQARKVEALGLSERIDTVVYARTCGDGSGKPHPDAFRAVLNGLDTPPSRTVFVGDDWDADIVGASRVGMRTIWVTRRRRVWDGEVSADACVTKLRSVPAVAEDLIESACGPREESESSSAAARASGGGAPRAVRNACRE